MSRIHDTRLLVVEPTAKKVKPDHPVGNIRDRDHHGATRSQVFLRIAKNGKRIGEMLENVSEEDNIENVDFFDSQILEVADVNLDSVRSGYLGTRLVRFDADYLASLLLS